MKNDDKPIANPFVILREEFDDWAVLFNPDTGHGFGLSPTGVYLWKLLDGKHPIHEMLKVLRRDFEEVPRDAGAQIVAFVEELAQHGMVTNEATPPHQHRLPEPNPTSMTIRYDEATRLAYELPRLIDFSGERAVACGNCQSGSGDTTGNCYNVGHINTAECNTGNVAGSYCYNGNTPGNAYGHTLGCSWCGYGCGVTNNGGSCATTCSCGNQP